MNETVKVNYSLFSLVPPGTPLPPRTPLTDPPHGPPGLPRTPGREPLTFSMTSLSNYKTEPGRLIISQSFRVFLISSFSCPVARGLPSGLEASGQPSSLRSLCRCPWAVIGWIPQEIPLQGREIHSATISQLSVILPTKLKLGDNQPPRNVEFDWQTALRQDCARVRGFYRWGTS